MGFFRLGGGVPGFALLWTEVNLWTKSTYSMTSASHCSCCSLTMPVSLFPVHAFILLPTCGEVSHGHAPMPRISTHPRSSILLERFLVLCRHGTLQQHSCNLRFIC